MPLPNPLENPQGTPTPTAKTLGELYDTVKSGLTPEQQSELQNRAMDKFGGMRGMAEKLKGGITENTRSELSELLHDMPGKDAILAKIDPLIPSSEVLQKGTDALKRGIPSIDATAAAVLTASVDTLRDEATRAVTGEGGKAVGNMVHAVSSGDIRGAVAGAKEVKGVFATLSESFSNAFAGLIELLEKMLGFKFGWLSDLVKKDKKGNEKGDAAKPSAEAEGAPARTGEDPEEVKRRKAEEEKKSREALREMTGQKLWASFIKTGWIKDPESKKKEFFEVFSQYSNEFVDLAKEVGVNIHDNKEWNIFDSFVKYPVLITRFIAVLIAKKIIPGNMIMTQAYDSARAGLRVYLMSPYTLITNGPSAILTQAAVLHKEDIAKLDDVEKQAIISSLHATMAPQLYLSGKITSTLAKISLLGMYWDQGTGLVKIRGIMQNALGDLSKGANEMSELVDMLGDKPLTDEFRLYRESTEKIVKEARIRAEVAQAYMSAKKSGLSPVQVAEYIEKNIDKSFISQDSVKGLMTKIRGAKDEQKILSVVGDYLQTFEGGTFSDLEKIRGHIRTTFSPLETEKNLGFFKQQTENMLRRYGESLSKVVQADIPGWKAFQRIGLGLTEAQLIDAIEKNHLAIKVKNAEDAKGILQQILKTVPKGFEHIFNGITVAVIVTDVAQTEGATNKVNTAFRDIAAMWPIVGGLMLMHEGMTMEGWVPAKIGYLAGGGVLTALQVHQVAKIYAETGSWLRTGGRALLSPITTITDTVAAVGRGTQYGYQAARFALKPGGVTGITGLAREATVAQRLRPAGFLGAGILITYFVMNQIFEKETEEMMKKAGIIKEDGTTATGTELKEGWQKLPVLERGKILSQMIEGTFGGSDRVVSYNAEKNQVIVHAAGKEDGGVPVSLDTFDSIKKMFDDLGIPNPSLFMSEDTTKKMKQAIDKMPIDTAKKQEFYAKFGITA